MDADRVTDWTDYLRPLEEGHQIFVLIANELPSAVKSRVSVYRVGYLSDSEVMTVLAQRYPRFPNRPLLAKLANGTLEGIEKQAKAAETFDSFEKALIERKCPNLRESDPVAVASCIRVACSTVMGGKQVKLSAEAKASIGFNRARSFLSHPSPKTTQSARNQVTLFFSELK